MNTIDDILYIHFEVYSECEDCLPSSSLWCDNEYRAKCYFVIMDNEYYFWIQHIGLIKITEFHSDSRKILDIRNTFWYKVPNNYIPNSYSWCKDILSKEKAREKFSLLG